MNFKKRGFQQLELPSPNWMHQMFEFEVSVHAIYCISLFLDKQFSLYFRFLFELLIRLYVFVYIC